MEDFPNVVIIGAFALIIILLVVMVMGRGSTIRAARREATAAHSGLSNVIEHMDSGKDGMTSNVTLRHVEKKLQRTKERLKE